MSSPHLRETCLGKSFLVVAFSADSDSPHHDFLKPRYDVITSVECRQITSAQIFEVMSSHELFVTDFLYFLKCLRNRLSIHPLTPHHSLTSVTAKNLSKIFLIGNCLETKSNRSQLKDAVALQMFALENLVILLANGNLHEALYFLPIVLW
jgi:hypothetical protein